MRAKQLFDFVRGGLGRWVKSQQALAMPFQAPFPQHKCRRFRFDPNDHFLQEPAPLNHLRKLCGMCTAAVCSALTELSNKGEVVRDARATNSNRRCPFPAL
jgi:hypothetical protein